MGTQAGLAAAPLTGPEARRGVSSTARSYSHSGSGCQEHSPQASRVGGAGSWASGVTAQHPCWPRGPLQRRPERGSPSRRCTCPAPPPVLVCSGALGRCGGLWAGVLRCPRCSATAGLSRPSALQLGSSGLSERGTPPGKAVPVSVPAVASGPPRAEGTAPAHPRGRSEPRLLPTCPRSPWRHPHTSSPENAGRGAGGRLGWPGSGAGPLL